MLVSYEQEQICFAACSQVLVTRVLLGRTRTTSLRTLERRHCCAGRSLFKLQIVFRALFPPCDEPQHHVRHSSRCSKCCSQGHPKRSAAAAAKGTC